MRTKFLLIGDHDEDYFLTKDNLGAFHWEMLLGCYHQGQCDDDCIEAAKFFDIKDYEKAKRYLEECGASEENIENDEDVLVYYLWMLSGNIQDND